MVSRSLRMALGRLALGSEVYSEVYSRPLSGASCGALVLRSMVVTENVAVDMCFSLCRCLLGVKVSLRLFSIIPQTGPNRSMWYVSL